MDTETKRLKVLLASSATTVLPSLKFIIKKTFKLDVITASQPEEVIEQVKRHRLKDPFDLIITGAFKHSETDYTKIIKQVKQIDPRILCALYTGDTYAENLAKSSNIRLDGCFIKKNGPHADLKPLFDRLAGIA